MLVLLTMYTLVSRNEIFTVLTENPTENFPTYRNSLDCVINIDLIDDIDNKVIRISRKVVTKSKVGLLCQAQLLSVVE